MKVLLTGAFGNIGSVVLEELLRRGHSVRCFELPTKPNQRRARRLAGQAEVVWGDIRNPADVTAAVAGQEVVLHLAFVIPKLSRTGVGSEERPDWARAINVGGTMNLLAAMKTQQPPPRILFASSLHVYGRTQHLPPPRTVDDPVQPVEHYALHKVACEEMVKGSGLPWTIFRFAACMPVQLILDPAMFDVPLDNRIEYVHAKDIATAIANALERDEVWGRTWLIGGGPRCQYTYREVVKRIMEAVGIGMLPETAFSTVPFNIDWLDTRESQRVLNFQHHTLDDYVAELRAALGYRRSLVVLMRPAIRAWLLRQSPYYRQAQLKKRPVPAAQFS